MPIELAAEYYADTDVLELQAEHYFCGYDYPVSGDALAYIRERNFK